MKMLDRLFQCKKIPKLDDLSTDADYSHHYGHLQVKSNDCSVDIVMNIVEVAAMLHGG